MSPKLKAVAAKLYAAAVYISAHRKQLSAAVALGMGLLEVVQKAH